MFPVLYPTSDFTDTDILAHHRDTSGDISNRIVSIAQPWIRKVACCMYSGRTFMFH